MNIRKCFGYFFIAGFLWIFCGPQAQAKWNLSKCDEALTKDLEGSNDWVESILPERPYFTISDIHFANNSSGTVQIKELVKAKEGGMVRWASGTILEMAFKYKDRHFSLGEIMWSNGRSVGIFTQNKESVPAWPPGSDSPPSPHYLVDFHLPDVEALHPKENDLWGDSSDEEKKSHPYPSILAFVALNSLDHRPLSPQASAEWEKLIRKIEEKMTMIEPTPRTHK